MMALTMGLFLSACGPDLQEVPAGPDTPGKPDTEQTDPDQPDPEKPDPDQPDPDQPDPEKPDPEPVDPPVGEGVWTKVRYDYHLTAGDVVCFAVTSKAVALGAAEPAKNPYFKKVDVTFTDGKITSGGMTEFTLGGTPGHWTFTTSQGALQAVGEKRLQLGGNATEWRIRFDVDGVASVNCNYGDIMYNVNAPRFTVYHSASSAQMLRVEIYKKDWNAPVENGRHPEVILGELNCTEITPEGVTLTQAFTDASAVPDVVGFHYSTDKNAFENNTFDYIEAPAPQSVDGSFRAYLKGLAPNTTYYVRSYTKVYGSGDFALENKTFNSKLVTFTTEHGGEPGPDPDPDVPGTEDGRNWHGHLVNYEIPHAEVNIPAGKEYSSTVNERSGGTKAYIYDTKAPGQRIVTHTFAKTDGKAYRNYTFLYDYEKKLPLWLSYHLNRGYCGTGGNRTNAWNYDPAVPEKHQPNLKNSYGSGYNRGHMMASHARSAITEANRQAFYFTNMTPQDERNLNTGGCSWNELEDHEMSILPSGRDTLYVVTGCTFDTPVKWITSKKGDRCAVPKECYKCFMMCSFDADGKMTSAKGIGYLMPNDKNGRNPYSSFARTIDEIESITGFDFFANVPKELQDAAESKKTEL